MNENKTTTYGDLKCRKQEMRDKNLVVVNMEEYLQNMHAIKDAEDVLLRSIFWVDIEPARQKKCRTGAIVCFGVAVIAAVLLIVGLFGCHTVNGVGRDLSAWSSPYIEHQER